MRKLLSIFFALCLVMGLSFADTAVPSCMELDSSGEYYYLTGNIESPDGENCINITADGITLDLRGYEINGSLNSWKTAIKVTGNNVRIENGTVAQSYLGIFVDMVNYTTIRNITAHNNTNSGFYCWN